MGWFEQTVHDFAVFLSRILEPLAVGVDIVNRSVHHQLGALGVPFGWQATIVSVLWALVVFMVVRTLSGWARLVAMTLFAVSMAKLFGFLPGG